MKTRTPLIRAALAMAMIGSAFALERVPAAGAPGASAHFPHPYGSQAAQPGVGMSVEANAPLHATLLPELAVSASASDADLVVATKLATDAALPVTLMPTVHVFAKRDKLAALDAPLAFDATEVALLAAAE
ncbi:hypothetical protein [Dokdonella sp.]|uniref:hypothetical protein n=1 Tax=Dokdonella sp. TaxID=2291710 RepID=UPI003784CF88